jgi:hypothetical protein
MKVDLPVYKPGFQCGPNSDKLDIRKLLLEVVRFFDPNDWTSMPIVAGSDCTRSIPSS